MKIIIILEKYGGYCNRLFQSLHYQAYSIEKGIKFFNPSLIGVLRFDNNFFYFFDKVNNLFLCFFSKFLKIFFKTNNIFLNFNSDNYIRLVSGWDFRELELTEKYHKELKAIYNFDTKNISKKAKFLKIYLNNLKKNGKYLVVVHVRRTDYKSWNNGKYYFTIKFYKYVINNLKKNLLYKNKNPFFIIISDEKISSKLKVDFISNGSWKEDQIILQSCNLIVGPPSTFTMWASYIAKIPLIKLESKDQKDFLNGKVCKG